LLDGSMRLSQNKFLKKRLDLGVGKNDIRASEIQLLIRICRLGHRWRWEEEEQMAAQFVEPALQD
jgi:hypothetical protein